jgi:quaternary ammonium compound-resistance protein SugE
VTAMELGWRIATAVAGVLHTRATSAAPSFRSSLMSCSCRWPNLYGGEPVAWILIVIAGLFETGFAILLKQSAHFTRPWPTVGFAACALISFGLLSWAVSRLEVGPAYAVWTGIGAAGTAVVGMAVLGESVSALKLVSIGLVLAGVVGLNLSGVTP